MGSFFLFSRVKNKAYYEKKNKRRFIMNIYKNLLMKALAVFMGLSGALGLLMFI